MKQYILYDSVYVKFWKNETVTESHCDRKKMNNCLGMGEGVQRQESADLQWGTRKIGGNGYIYYLDYNDGFTGVNIETI